jgi:signal transduction histidine kinase
MSSSNLTPRQRRHMNPQISPHAPASNGHAPRQHRSTDQKKTDHTPDTQRTWWRSHWIGYPVSILLVGIATLLSYFLKSFASAPYFLGQPFVFAIIAIALFWGLYPVIFTIILEYLAVDIFLVSPSRMFIIEGWGDMVTYGPFVLAQLVIALLTIQGELRRRHLLQAKKKIETEAQELERANRFKSLFLSIASHELKTPITAIRAQAQLALRRAAKLQPTAPERLPWSTYMEKIEAETHRLQTLVNDLLDLGSIDSGKMPLQFAECDLGKLCRDVVEEQEALSERRIDLEIPPNPILLQADHGRLTQVIINLVTNAVKYSPQNMPVQVTAEVSHTHAIVQVHNDGSVIPQEQQEHIFEPFYRLPSNEEGSGLGLAISKEIVERHGGHIWVESSEEKGTTFFVKLPY